MKIISAIIGMGIGQKHLEAIDNYKKSKVKIICEKDKSKIKILKKKYPKKIITSDENQIYSDNSINLVSIASYDNYHFTQVKKCIEAKKNIIVEKPLCLSLNEFNEIKRLLKKSKNLLITSNLVLRVNSLFKYFKKKTLYENIINIDADYIYGRKKKLYGWRSKVKNYSIILGAAVHVIDLIMWLTNKKPKSVMAYANDVATKSTKFTKKSFCLLIFEFPGDVIVKISANTGAIYDHIHDIKIFQKNNTLVNSKFGAYEIYKSKKKNVVNKIHGLYPDKVRRKLFIRNFIDHLIDKKKKLLLTQKDLFNVMSVCFAAEESLKVKKKIKIKY